MTGTCVEVRAHERAQEAETKKLVEAAVRERLRKDQQAQRGRLRRLKAPPRTSPFDVPPVSEGEVLRRQANPALPSRSLNHLGGVTLGAWRTSTPEHGGEPGVEARRHARPAAEACTSAGTRRTR